MRATRVIRVSTVIMSAIRIIRVIMKAVRVIKLIRVTMTTSFPCLRH
jgi:hypothetical protein